jgi:hypothetical protein
MPPKKVADYVLEEGVLNLAHPTFLRLLRTATLDGFPDQQSLDSPLDKALWALWILQDAFKHNHPRDSSVYAGEISEVLETRGVALSKINIVRALARAGDKVHRKEIGDDSSEKAFKIMQAGKSYLQKKYGGDQINVTVVDGGKPWTARHKTFADMAFLLKGHVCVLDKFYGAATLGVLYHLKNATSVKFLTAKASGSPAAFQSELARFRLEFPNLEVRLYPHEHELHDRYIITRDALLIIGHGVKDFGTKESFVLMLTGDVSRDIRKTLQVTFDTRWAISTPIA